MASIQPGFAMELRHLRYFTALAECLNFTRAAERVHVTQSTLSHQIRQLEDELGHALFERVGKRVAMTQAGEVFLAFAARALREVDQGLGALKSSSAELAGEVRVGATNTFNLGFIPACTAAFLVRHPTAKVIVTELAADEIGARLNAGDLDLGIAYRPTGPSDLWFEPLYNEEMALVVSSEHPLARRKRIRMIELHEQRLVLLPEAFATRALLNECFQACGAEPVVVSEMDTIAPMLGLAARSQIGAIVAIGAVPAGAGLCIVPLESPTPIRTPGILRKRGARPTTQTHSFSSIVRQLAVSSNLRGKARQRP
jgi:LysR family transcriptional regulator, cyn operon transcriptional activator